MAKNTIYTCKMCGYNWIGRATNLHQEHPKKCPNRQCQSVRWNVGRNLQTNRELYKRNNNDGGNEWNTCMFFDDTKEVIECCGNQGTNVATIEVPLGVVDITWVTGNTTVAAAHPSERGCYITMPLVLCALHMAIMVKR